MPKQILMALSEFGYWGEELLGPLEMLDAQDYQVEVVTNHGRRPTALPYG